MSSAKSIAFFGATGGSTAACLAKCLKAEYTCTALVRKASKLTTLLQDSHFITPTLISKHLTLIVGDAKDSHLVNQTLFPALLNPSNPRGNTCVDLIISGTGCYPVMKKGHLLPSQEDPTLCQDVANTILSVLRARAPVIKPCLVMISTTGISKYGRDVPLLLVPLHYIFLRTSLRDKKIMEELVIAAVKELRPPIGSFVLVRPSVLTNGRETGLERVKWDVEDGGVARGAIGYSISRRDVGGFVFEVVVRSFESGKEVGGGRIYSVTY